MSADIPMMLLDLFTSFEKSMKVPVDWDVFKITCRAFFRSIYSFIISDENSNQTLKCSTWTLDIMGLIQLFSAIHTNQAFSHFSNSSDAISYSFIQQYDSYGSLAFTSSSISIRTLFNYYPLIYTLTQKLHWNLKISYIFHTLLVLLKFYSRQCSLSSAFQHQAFTPQFLQKLPFLVMTDVEQTLDFQP